MARKRFMAEQVILNLRETEVGLAQGKAVGQGHRFFTEGGKLLGVVRKTQ